MHFYFRTVFYGYALRNINLRFHGIESVPKLSLLGHKMAMAV